MTKETLLKEIESRFKLRRDFIIAFNEKAGKTLYKGKLIDPLDETVLSRQLKGKRELSSAWQVAYRLFFDGANGCANDGGV